MWDCRKYLIKTINRSVNLSNSSLETLNFEGTLTRFTTYYTFINMNLIAILFPPNTQTENSYTLIKHHHICLFTPVCSFTIESKEEHNKRTSMIREVISAVHLLGTAKLKAHFGHVSTMCSTPDRVTSPIISTGSSVSAKALWLCPSKQSR